MCSCFDIGDSEIAACLHGLAAPVEAMLKRPQAELSRPCPPRRGRRGDRLAETVARSGIGSPAIVVVGDVAGAALLASAQAEEARRAS